MSRRFSIDHLDACENLDQDQPQMKIFPFIKT